MAKRATLSMKKRKRKTVAPIVRAWSHPQKKPHCCETYRKAHNHRCWSCQNIELLKTPLGRAILSGYGSVSASNWEPSKPARSVSDCLADAEA